MLANAVTVTDATFEHEIERSKGLTLVDFSATWCPPCRLIEPILDEIALTRRGDLRVATIDTDQNLQTTVRFNVRSAPTILFFKDGQLVDRIVGAVPKAHIERVIEKYCPAA
jgi:thioredoxin 1